jgi:hypothetical protein
MLSFSDSATVLPMFMLSFSDSATALSMFMLQHKHGQCCSRVRE